MKSLLIVFAVFFTLCFFNCKKYPEDGKWSKNSVKNRLKNRWELKECLINGVESINEKQYYVDKNDLGQLNDSVVYSLIDFIIEFDYYKSTVYGHTNKVNKVNWAITKYYFRLNEGVLYEGNNEWELEEKKNKLKFKKDFRYEHYFNYDQNKLKILYNQSNEPWNIRKLTDKEMILETTNSDNNKIRLKFNRL
jgi:hypothetical protein